MMRKLAGHNAIAWLALFFSLAGTSIAASRYIITSTNQIKPSVLRQLRAPVTRTLVGPQGATGEPGTPGTSDIVTIQGTPGIPGPKGETGIQGTAGTKGEAGPAGVIALETPTIHYENWEDINEPQGEKTILCPKGETAISGGATVVSGPGEVRDAHPPWSSPAAPEGWAIHYGKYGSIEAHFDGWVVCVE